MTVERIRIFKTKPVQNVINALHEGESATARISTIIERFEYLMSGEINLSDTEKAILLDAFSHRPVTPLAIANYYPTVKASTAGTEQEREMLVSRLSTMTSTERVSVLESIGL